MIMAHLFTRSSVTILLSALALCAAAALPQLAQAAPGFTGNAINDFNVIGRVVFSDVTGDVGLPPTAPAGTVSGWDVRQTFLFYDPATDVMYVGYDTIGILGDPDGDGDPSNTSSWLSGVLGTDFPDLSSTESFAFLIDTDPATTGLSSYTASVGVSASADITSFGIYNFTGTAANPAFSFGSALGSTSYFANPSAAAPDLEFRINNFSTLPGFSFTPGESFTFRGLFFAGSFSDDGIGEDTMENLNIVIPATGSIAGSVCSDDDGDGTQGSGESGLQNVTVRLLNSSGTTLATTTTDSNGEYTFDFLYESSYSVAVDFTTVASGLVATGDSDGIVTEHTVSTPIAEGEDLVGVEFCYGPEEEPVAEDEADIKVTKTVDEDEFIAGEQPLYTIEVKNRGNADVVNVILTDDVPNRIEDVEYRIVGVTKWDDWSGSVTLGDMAVDEIIEVQLRGTIKNSATGTITNEATVSTDTEETNLANNVDDVDITIVEEVEEEPEEPVEEEPEEEVVTETEEEESEESGVLNTTATGTTVEPVQPATLPNTGALATGWIILAGLLTGAGPVLMAGNRFKS